MLKKESGNGKRFFFFKIICLPMLKEHFNFCSENLNVLSLWTIMGFSQQQRSAVVAGYCSVYV